MMRDSAPPPAVGGGATSDSPPGSGADPSEIACAHMTTREEQPDEITYCVPQNDGGDDDEDDDESDHAAAATFIQTIDKADPDLEARRRLKSGESIGCCSDVVRRVEENSNDAGQLSDFLPPSVASTTTLGSRMDLRAMDALLFEKGGGEDGLTKQSQSQSQQGEDCESFSRMEDDDLSTQGAKEVGSLPLLATATAATADPAIVEAGISSLAGKLAFPGDVEMIQSGLLSSAQEVGKPDLDLKIDPELMSAVAATMDAGKSGESPAESPGGETAVRGQGSGGPAVLKPSNPFRSPFYRVVTDGLRREQFVEPRVPAAEIRLEDGVRLSHEEVSLRVFPNVGQLSVATDIGGRKSQEDRYTFASNLSGREDCFLLGVFDGTVGEFASETVKKLVVPHLLESKSWQAALALLDSKTTTTPTDRSAADSGSETTTTGRQPLSPDSETADKNLNETPAGCSEGPPTAPPANIRTEQPETRSPKVDTGKPVTDAFTSDFFPLLADAMDEMYLASDSELVSRCAAANQHYASSTSVVALVAGKSCCVGHLGDSRAALAHLADGQLWANFVTDDHKPNQAHERSRIRRSGGSVEYLHNHNNKPFIRGGDFTVRKSRGEQPMQLQYSRAFGGKDLKMFGLSNEPDILCFKIEPSHSCLILASDGIWDVLASKSAAQIVTQARSQGRDPARALVDSVLQEQKIRRQPSDNLTAAVLFFDTETNKRFFDPR